MSAEVRKVNVKDSALIVLPKTAGKVPRRGKFVSLVDLRKLAKCSQVAAVCYRRRGDEIEFLLVRTRGSGRWTFPKGSAEPGLTQAQAAALEAFEEAGVHGRIEEVSFARYAARKVVRKSDARSTDTEVAVNAFLCEVTRLCAPKESRRNRTWFRAGEAKLRLCEGRDKRYAAAFRRVVDRAVARIECLIETVDHSAPAKSQGGFAGVVVEDYALRAVQFEAFRRRKPVTILPHYRSRIESGGDIAVRAECDPQASLCEVLPFGPLTSRRPRLLVAAKRFKALRS